MSAYLPDRLDAVLRRCVLDSGCWVWSGGRDKNGYAIVTIQGRSVRGHRWVWEQMTGDIPAGLVLDHLCRNPPCLNPDHLEPVTAQVNTVRGNGPSRSAENGRRANLVKTQCPAGHSYSGENLIASPGRRECRECGRRRSREYWRAKHGKPQPS
ncbi:HNH endonuclease signature motif containing protein [Streptomyces antimycoticus]|uniref:HNH endonuclease signature motif containing protein n=1 Tax=Streptomyces antimycoticus TaxID=68175 RepID=UPI00342C8B4E